jgi:hypothetical protein
LTNENTGFLWSFPHEYMEGLHPKVKDWFISAADKINGLDNGASPLQAISATGQIKPNSLVVVVTSRGGAVTLTSDPQITAAQADKVVLMIEGLSDTNTVTLVNGNGLSLAGAANFVIKNNSVIQLHYSFDKKLWIENFRRA